MEIVSETELLISMRNGDRQSFTSLYRKHLRYIYKYVYPMMGNREDTLDIVQEVFARAWEKREHYEIRLLIGKSFTAYLIKIAKNVTFDYLREQKKQRENSENYLGELKVEITDHKLILGEYYRIAQEAIIQLPPKRLRIFQLSTQEDMSLQEIAEILQISKNVVKKQLYAATAFVRKYLEDRGCIPLFISLLISLYIREF